MSATAAHGLLETISNLSHFHREHEKFYAQAPLEQAIGLQRWTRALEALADHWQGAEPSGTPLPNRYAGCDDLNATAAIDTAGILFLEGEGEPAEIAKMKRDLGAAADDFEQTGSWLAEAMQASWATAAALLPQRELADLLGERHRIIANDWRSASLNTLISHLLRRAVELVDQVDLSPAALRADLAGPRSAASYIYSACELLDYAADLVTASATLVHDNERRWRLFHDRVTTLTRERSPG